MKEFLRLEKHLTALSGSASTGISLTRGDLAHRKITILISGVSKANLGNAVSVTAKAGASSVELTAVSDIVHDAVGKDSCIMVLDFPVHFLHIVTIPIATDINITVYGGNS